MVVVLERLALSEWTKIGEASLRDIAPSQEIYISIFLIIAVSGEARFSGTVRLRYNMPCPFRPRPILKRLICEKLFVVEQFSRIVHGETRELKLSTSTVHERYLLFVMIH